VIAVQPWRSPCLASLHGMGGHLMLHADRIRILRHGAWFTAVTLVSHVERELETTIRLDRLAAVHLVRAAGLLQFLRFSYAGAPEASGHGLRDAFAENAFMLGIGDNRPLLAMKARIMAAVRDARGAA
jgi:hypothetical protein